ncbi:MAG TPA: DUF4162 domain-containing protein, partial [Solirubrobacterales bacterium]
DELKRGLEGDAIHVELGGELDEPAVRSALERIDGLTDVAMTDGTVHARAADGARTVPAVLGALEGAGLEVASVTVARPSLDDVYLCFAGRTFGSAEAEHAEKPDQSKEANR